MDPFKVAAKKIDTVLGADVRSPGADPKKARRLVAESRRGDTVANPYHDSPFTGAITISLKTPLPILTAVG